MKPLIREPRTQLALYLEREPRCQLSEQTHQELLNALADLLLEALGEEVSQQPSDLGGGHEPQNHG